MPESTKFNLMKDLYEMALEREEQRRNTFEQKSANLVGFFGAIVGVFITILVPELVAKEFLIDINKNCKAFILWIISILCFAVSIIVFFFLVLIWRKMLKPISYMYPAPSSLKDIEDLTAIEKEYLKDLDKSLKNNQLKINELGTQFIKMGNLIIGIIIFLVLAVVFFVWCKLIL